MKTAPKDFIVIIIIIIIIIIIYLLIKHISHEHFVKFASFIIKRGGGLDTPVLKTDRRHCYTLYATISFCIYIVRQKFFFIKINAVDIIDVYSLCVWLQVLK